MDRIGLRELLQNASRYVERVAGGESIEVAVRGRLVARLVPAGEGSWDDLILRGDVLPATSGQDLLDEPVRDYGFDAIGGAAGIAPTTTPTQVSLDPPLGETGCARAGIRRTAPRSRCSIPDDVRFTAALSRTDCSARSAAAAHSTLSPTRVGCSAGSTWLRSTTDCSTRRGHWGQRSEDAGRHSPRRGANGPGAARAGHL